MVALFRLFASDKKTEKILNLKKFGATKTMLSVCVMSVWQAWITFENC